MFTVVFTIGARLVNKTAFAAFVLLTGVLLFAGLANILGGDAATLFTRISGYLGILNGIAAFWLASGLLLNTMYGRDLLPLGAPSVA